MRLTQFLRFRVGSILPAKEQFVPSHKPVQWEDVKRLEDFLMSKPNILVLTGAGISTESGIPDYRSEGVGLYARSNHKPIRHEEFMGSAALRQRFWARNFVGWPRFSAFKPNAVHMALARFEREERIQGIVTQNVDRLHSKAGSRNVVELHGSGYEVRCMGCDYRVDRHSFQDILNTMNPVFREAQTTLRPDGDVDIPQEYIESFCVPRCPQCGDDKIKPEYVFFGDCVPADRLKKIAEMVWFSDGILILGSSLLVLSGYRIALQAKDLNLPVAIVNIGETRADHLADIKLSAKCGDVIPKLFYFKK